MPEKVPDREPPFDALNAPLALREPPTLSTLLIVEDPVTASAVVVAPVKVAPPLKASCVVVAPSGNGYAKPPVVQGSAMTEPSAFTVRHCPAEAERLLMARFVVVACDVVALSAVKFCKVVEPVTRRLESV